MKDEKKYPDFKAANIGGKPQQTGQQQHQQPKQPQQNWQRPSNDNRSPYGSGNMSGNLNKNKQQPDRNKL